MNALLQQLRDLGPARLALIAGTGFAVLGFIIYFASRFGRQPMDLLFSELNGPDSSAIIKELESQNIPYELRAGGSAIYVPADQALKQRLQLAQTTLGGAIVGYELFDNMDALGATNFLQNVTLTRALEGELARTIMAINNVQAARVHLVMPRREMFSRETQKPSAAVYIKMKHGRLNDDQVRAIQGLVAASVPKLKPGAISIIDERGSLLSSNTADEGIAVLATQEKMRRQEERRLANSIQTLLESVLGPGKARAEVSADINFDKVVTQEEIFDPDQTMPRSTTTRQENLQTTEKDPGAVTVSNNLPDADTADNGPSASSNEQRTEETTNFEISKRVVNQIKEGPSIRRLSVAVLVDGVYETGPNGEPLYQPRPEEEMEQLEAIIRSAIGYNADRGDQVELVNMRFRGLDDMQAAEPWSFMGFSKREVVRMGEEIGLAIIAIILVLLVVRPMIARAFKESSATAAEAPLLTADGLAGQMQLTGPVQALDEEDDDLIDLDKVEGRVKASSVYKIGEIVDKHPEEALSIIRNWMYREA